MVFGPLPQQPSTAAQTSRSSSRVSRPLTWQGPKQTRTPRKGNKGNSKAQLLRHLRFMQLIQGGQVHAPTINSSRLTRARMAATAVYTLRAMHMQQVAMHNDLKAHMDWLKVELGCLPGIVLTQVEKLVGDVHNLVRFLVCLMAILFLLR